MGTRSSGSMQAERERAHGSHALRKPTLRRAGSSASLPTSTARSHQPAVSEPRWTSHQGAGSTRAASTACSCARVARPGPAGRCRCAGSAACCCSLSVASGATNTCEGGASCPRQVSAAARQHRTCRRRHDSGRARSAALRRVQLSTPEALGASANSGASGAHLLHGREELFQQGPKLERLGKRQEVEHGAARAAQRALAGQPPRAPPQLGEEHRRQHGQQPGAVRGGQRALGRESQREAGQLAAQRLVVRQPARLGPACARMIRVLRDRPPPGPPRAENRWPPAWTASPSREP